MRVQTSVGHADVFFMRMDADESAQLNRIFFCFSYADHPHRICRLSASEWPTVVANHWSDDGMVTNHGHGLEQPLTIEMKIIIMNMIIIKILLPIPKPAFSLCEMKTFIIQGGFEKVPLVKTTPSHKTLLPPNIGKELIKVKMLN